MLIHAKGFKMMYDITLQKLYFSSDTISKAKNLLFYLIVNLWNLKFYVLFIIGKNIPNI